MKPPAAKSRCARDPYRLEIPLARTPVKEHKRPWIAAVLALTLGGPGCFYLGWRRGLTATVVWLILVWFVVAGGVRQNGLDPYAAAIAFFLLWVIQTPLAWLAYRSCKRGNTEAAVASMALDASQQLKIVGVLVIGLSGLGLFIAAVGLEVDQKKITDALLAGMALWGLVTGIGVLLLRPWARLSSLVFYGLLCVSGALSGALIIVHIFTSVVDVGAMLVTVPFVLISLTIGVQGLRFFKRIDIRRHFAETW